MSEFIYDWTPNKQHQKEEIVRCRDCRWCVKKGYRLYCELNAGGFPEVEPDGFCAWGERTEDERMEERTKTEQNGAGITEELREWVANHRAELGMGQLGTEPLKQIADRIDERYSVKVERLEKYREAVNSMLNEYVKLPTDADGEPVHIGDELTNGKDIPAKVRSMMLIEEGWMVSSQPRPGLTVAPEILRHHHAPTVEDVLEELLREYDRDDSELTNGEIIERFAAKLRLAGDDE